MCDFPISAPEGHSDMKRKRYTEEQIISILIEHEAGASVAGIARRHGVVENAVFRWKSMSDGRDAACRSAGLDPAVGKNS
mgnify:CR=1 FL=1